GILKGAGIGRDRGEQVFGDHFVERQILTLQQLEQNLAGSWSGRIDVDQVTVARIARVMIDVNPELALANCLQRRAESRPSRSVEGNDDVEILRFPRGKSHNFAPRKKGKLFEQSLLIPYFHFFPELAQRQADCDLAAERITIRADV